MNKEVYVYKCEEYDSTLIESFLTNHINVYPGETVFIKPNWVLDPWKSEEDKWIATVTQISIIETVLKIVVEKLKGNGYVIIGDAPMARADIKKILNLTNIERLITKYRSTSIQIEIIDIRKYYWKYLGNTCIKRFQLLGDPKGNKIVELGMDSVFGNKKNKNYSMDDTEMPVSHFHGELHNSYEVSQSILECDVVINLPKLKTHRLAGMTCAMKNLVGIISNKNCVPHRTKGSNEEEGDSYPKGHLNAINEDKGLRGISRKITRQKIPIINILFIPLKFIHDKTFGKDIIKKAGYGAWYGNDTIWRSIIDLNRILLYCDKKGNMQDTIQRRYLCIADGIIAGEREGPLHPTPKKSNIILVSENPVALDTVACVLMGFDNKKIKFLSESYQNMRWPLVDFQLEEIIIKSNIDHFNNRFSYTIKYDESLKFIPTEGWKEHIEATG